MPMRLPALALCLCAAVASAQQAVPPAAPPDPTATLVGRLDPEAYKATIKGLTQFGDRRQGTDRNRAAVDWIEAQLKSYGCTNTERISTSTTPPPPTREAAAAPGPAMPAGARIPALAPGGGRRAGRPHAAPA